MASFVDFLEMCRNNYGYDELKEAATKLRSKNGTYQGLPYLLYTIEYENIAATKILLELGYNPNVKLRRNMTLLFVAIKHENIELIKLLLDHNVQKELILSDDKIISFKDITDNQEIIKLIEQY